MWKGLEGPFSNLKTQGMCGVTRDFEEGGTKIAHTYIHCLFFSNMNTELIICTRAHTHTHTLSV